MEGLRAPKVTEARMLLEEALSQAIKSPWSAVVLSVAGNALMVAHHPSLTR
jgi:hypothetical protein